MRSIESRLSAAISFLFIAAHLLLPSAATAAIKPRYGGTLSVELPTPSVSLDPRTWQAGSLESAAGEKFAALLFDRLVALDNYGRFQPVLATDWSHDPSNRRWEFTIRASVKFSDGSPLTPADVAAALQPLLPPTEQISASANAVVIQSPTPLPDLLEQLASGRYFFYRVLASGALAGTGPFLLADAPMPLAPTDGKNATEPPGAISNNTPSRALAGHLYFRANDETWSGRPFVDQIDVTLGVPPLRAMFDLQLGKADLIELSPDLVPRARQANLRIWTSEPVTLYGLCFEDAQTAAFDPRLREALSLSLDRGTMANVLLQKQAQPAATLLPQWLSGYAFLFNVDTNLERAKELRRALPANAAAGVDPLRLRVDPAGDLAKLLAERVAVNARQAAIPVQVISRPASRTGAGSPAPSNLASTLHLFAWHYSSLSSRAELDSMFAAYNLKDPSEGKATTADHEQLYARERQALEDRRMLPLIREAESVGLGSAVRDWMPSRWDECHLADVGLDLPEPAQPRSAAPGVTP
jgi:peptide/nickel transport system substrate-binding protein